MKQLRELTPLDDFQPPRVKQCSLAAYGLCMWARAMDTYDRVVKVVGPKKEALEKAMAELAIVMAELASKQADLKKVEDEVAALVAQLKGLKKEEEDLLYNVDLCEKK